MATTSTSSVVTDVEDGFEPGLLTAPTRTFHWADYIVFGLTLVIALVIGLYYGIKMRRSMTVKELLLGGQNMGAWPVSLSLVATLTSTLFVLGVPSEVYYGGDWPLYLALAFIPATIITVHVFIPIFHSLGVTSAYEYLGLRFNNIVRFMAALIFIVMSNFTQALSIYTPAVAFSLVAGVSMEVSILAAGIVCTFYTSLGGLRAVIVTDIFQVTTILAGIIGMLIKGSIDAGGIENIFKISSASRRLQLWSLNWTVNTTYSFWSQFFGGTVIFLGMFSANQQTVQRYCAVKECNQAQKAAYISMVFYIIAYVLVLLVGLVIYTFYYSCDPLVLNVIYSPDQVLPLFIMDTIGHLHGIPGLFSAAVFGAVLSSVSSGINSLAAVTLQDVIKPVHTRLKKKEISEYASKALVRVLALFYGALSIALSYIPVKIGTYILNIDVTFSAFGVLGGPIMGAFILGVMFPIANSLGAGFGLIGGLLFGFWMWMGRMVCRSSNWKPFEKEMPSDCRHYYNVTGITPAEPSIFPGKGVFQDCPLQELYDISYLWYGLITMAITVLVGVVVSLVSGGHGGKRVSSELLCWDRFKKRRKELERKKRKKSKWPFVEKTVVPPVPNPLIMKKDISPPSSDQVTNSGKVGDQLLMFTGGQASSASGENVLFQSNKGDLVTESNNPTERVLFQGEHNHGYISDSGYQGEVILKDPDGVLHQPSDQDAAFFANGIIIHGEPVAPQESALFQPGEPGPAVLQGNGVFPITTNNLDDQPLSPLQRMGIYEDEPLTYSQPFHHYVDQPQPFTIDSGLYGEPPVQLAQEASYYGDPPLQFVQENDYYSNQPVLYQPANNEQNIQPPPFPEIASNIGDSPMAYNQPPNNFISQPISSPIASYPEDVLHAARVLPGSEMQLIQRHRDAVANVSPLWS